MAAFPGSDYYPSNFTDHRFTKPTQTLFIGNLSPMVEQHELVHLFSQYGDIQEVGFVKGRYYAFISYSTVEAAIDALRDLHKFYLHGNHLNVQFKKFERKPFVFLGSPPAIPPGFEISDGLKNPEVGAKRMRYDETVENPESQKLEKSVELNYTKEYKWTGPVAKAGVIVCSARCFSTRRTCDFILPEILNFTSKFDLRILDEHPNRVAANTGVVWFEPTSDADMGNYYKFMDYLAKKGKAMVAELNENDHLIVVPPSEVSEKVLKVPQRMSIVGFIGKSKHQNLKTRIAENEFAQTQMGLKQVHEEMPSQSNPIRVEGTQEERFQATLRIAAAIVANIKRLGGFP